MNKIRIIFLVMVFIILIVSVMMFNTSKSSVSLKIDKISEFKITQISGNGKVYFDKNPIDSERLSVAKSVDIKRMQYLDEIYLMTDRHTSFQFYCFGTSFTVLPDSYMYYQPITKEILFYRGKLYWNKELKGKEVEISIKREEQGLNEPAPQIITLSDAGKVHITGDSIKVWNYSGNLKFNYGSETYNLIDNNYLLYKNDQSIKTSQILHSPEFISPESKVISQNEPGDSVVKFNWKPVKGAQRYILRLYSSLLMEDTLYEKEVVSNRLNMDLLQFEDFGEFYWQVSAYDLENNREGAPSEMGYLKLVGAILNKDKVLKPPGLVIKTLDVNGNLVLIEGVTDKNAQLFINDVPINVNMDGTFVHTINFEKIGRNRIVFKVISASGLETEVEKYANTYDE
jgi:hypothetical protein